MGGCQVGGWMGGVGWVGVCRVNGVGWGGWWLSGDWGGCMGGWVECVGGVGGWVGGWVGVVGA